MKTSSPYSNRTNFHSQAWLKASCALGAAMLACAAANAAEDTAAAEKPKDDKAKAEETEKAEPTAEDLFEGGKTTYNNWIELSGGGMMTSGSASQAARRQQNKTGAFGGIEDLHIQQDLDKKTTFTIDGRSIFDSHEYNLSLGVKREDLGYVKAGFQNSRTWYDSAGGYFPLDGLNYSLSDDAFTLDRGQVSVEAGLTLKNLPKAVFKYTHRTREGMKDSTVWGTLPTSAGTRGIYPSFWDIDEKSDIFQFDLTHRIKSTDLGVGVRYETGDDNNALKSTLQPGLPAERKVTDRQGTSYDMFSAHAFTETWIKKNLFLSTGFLYENLDNTFTGSRIYGSDFDVNYLPNALNSLGYFNLNGGSEKKQYVANLNLMVIPLRNFTIVPSVRVQKDDWDGDTAGTGTSGTTTRSFTSHNDREQLEVRERLDLRYAGITNWVFYAGPEWTQGDGNLKEVGGLNGINPAILPLPVNRETDDSRFFQKYFAGARWYPTRRVTVDVSGYYKDNRYDYDHLLDNAPNIAGGDRYPAFLVMQGFQTWDGAARLTLRPFNNVTLVSRYEYQESTISTRPDPASTLGQVDSSRMTSHIIAQNASWAPLNWLSFQAGFNYVLSDTRTPTSDYTQAILNSQNNYWTLNFNTGIVLDDKTDLNLGYYYYRSDNFEDNSAVGLPLGVAVEEHGVTAGVSRRLTQNLRLNLRYGYSHFDDTGSGGFRSYEAHMVYSSLQYRF